MSTEELSQEEQAQAQKPPRDAQGRFMPGYSGNPAGRPRGSANRLLQQVRDWSESRGVEILIEAAEAGNLDVTKTLVSMAMPKRRPAFSGWKGTCPWFIRVTSNAGCPFQAL